MKNIQEQAVSSMQLKAYKNQDSYWEDPKVTSPISSMTSVEDIPEKVKTLVEEFQQTPEEMKPVLKKMIETWLEEMKDSDYEAGEHTQQLRDFTYEMF